MKINWVSKTFDQLTTRELYQLLALRSKVFVVEQNCIYQDCDGYDESAHHCIGLFKDTVVAYARVLPPNTVYKNPSIGRVVVDELVRGEKLGYILLEKALKAIEMNYQDSPVTISAQEHLKKYYGRIGFVQVGESYLEDGIPHIQMIKN